MKVRSRLSILTNVSRDEVFQFLQSVASINRSDVIKAHGNYMTRALETVERAGIVRTTKVSNAKVYHKTKKIDMSDVIANHCRSLVMQVFRDELNLKVSDPEVVDGGDWVVRSMATKNTIFRFNLIFMDVNRARKLGNLALNDAVPVYISNDEDLIMSLIDNNQLKLIDNACLIAVIRGKSEVDLSMVIKDEYGKPNLTGVDADNRGLLIKIKHYPITDSIKSKLLKKYDHPRFSNIVLRQGGIKNEKR